VIRNTLFCIGLTLCAPIFVRAASGTTAAATCNTCANIHDAIQKSHKQCVEQFLDTGTDIEMLDTNAWTPLTTAIEPCSDGNPIAQEIFQLLIDRGADIDGKKSACNPLWLCGKWSRKSQAEPLLRAGASTITRHNDGTTTDVSNYGVIPDLLAQPDVHQAWEQARQNRATKNRCVKATPFALVISALGTWSVIYTIKQEYKKARKEIVAENKINNICMTDEKISNAVLERTWQNIQGKPWSQKKALITGITAMVGGAATALICWLK
jgi:hypothetical protein